MLGGAQNARIVQFFRTFGCHFVVCIKYDYAKMRLNASGTEYIITNKSKLIISLISINCIFRSIPTSYKIMW